MKRKDTAYTFRDGIPITTGTVRAYMPRNGGPPLLFATDIRMTILVHLALADGPVRVVSLWKHMGKRAPTALTPLIRQGIIARWRRDDGAAFVTLNPYYPIFEPLRHLLQVIGREYDFKAMSEVESWHSAGRPRLRKKYDLRLTFHDSKRTLMLLMIHVVGDANAYEIARCLGNTTPEWVRWRLRMFAHYGLLTVSRKTLRGGYNYRYAISDNVVANALRGVLEALDTAMPQWRIVATNQMTRPPRPKKREYNMRKNSRWKW